jgi:hypothetical protein
MVEGWNLRKRGILRTDDKAVNNACWKVNFWNTLFTTAVIAPLTILLMLAVLGDLRMPTAIYLSAVFVPSTTVTLIMRHKRLSELYKKINEAGIELERGKDEVKKLSKKDVEDIKSMKMFGIPYAFIIIFLSVMLAGIAVTGFIEGDLRRGITFAVLAVGNVYNIVKSVKAYVAKKRKK